MAKEKHKIKEKKDVRDNLRTKIINNPRASNKRDDMIAKMAY